MAVAYAVLDNYFIFESLYWLYCVCFEYSMLVFVFSSGTQLFLSKEQKPIDSRGHQSSGGKIRNKILPQICLRAMSSFKAPWGDLNEKNDHTKL